TITRPCTRGNSYHQFSDIGMHWSGCSDCNRFGGRYTTEGNELHFNQLISTHMACSEEINKEEARLLRNLEECTHYEINGRKQLVLFGGNDRTKVRAVFIPAQD